MAAPSDGDVGAAHPEPHVVSSSANAIPGNSLDYSYQIDECIRENVGQEAALMCCRIHPLIRDSVTVRTVPFHVEWRMDIARCSKSRRLAWLAICGSILAVLIVCILDFRSTVLKVLRDELGPLDTYSASVANSLLLTIMILLKMLWMPLKAAISVTMRERFEGGRSWCDYTQHSGIKGGGYIATCIVATCRYDSTKPAIIDGQRSVGELGAACSAQKPSRASAAPTASVEEGVPDMRTIYQAREVVDERNNGASLYPCCQGETTITLEGYKWCRHVRESLQDHWYRYATPLPYRMKSSWPIVDDCDELMSLACVLGKGTVKARTLYEQYAMSGNMNVAADVAKNEDRRLRTWLASWKNCALTAAKGSAWSSQAQQMRDILDGCMKTNVHSARWGVPLYHINKKSKIMVLNEGRSGLLCFPEDMLSTILPRYGHRVSVEEVAYLSAKGKRGDMRYYSPAVYIWWMTTVYIMRVITLLISNNADVSLLNTAVSLAFFWWNIWLFVTEASLNRDLRALWTGRVKYCCILGMTKAEDVTAQLLAKWNANVAQESSCYLNSFHTEAEGDSDVCTMSFDTFQRAGGLLLCSTGGTESFTCLDRPERMLAILPGARNLTVRQVHMFDDQIYCIGGKDWNNRLFSAHSIVSDSPCRIGVRVHNCDCAYLANGPHVTETEEASTMTSVMNPDRTTEIDNRRISAPRPTGSIEHGSDCKGEDMLHIHGHGKWTSRFTNPTMHTHHSLVSNPLFNVSDSSANGYEIMNTLQSGTNDDTDLK